MAVEAARGCGYRKVGGLGIGRGGMMARINLGCGHDIRDGWINVDQYPGPGVDLVHDLAAVPLPFPDGYAAHIVASHVLEHVLYWERVVEDAWRVLAPGGTFEIRVPYKLRGIDSAYHLRLFTPTTMDFCCMNAQTEGVSCSLERKLRFEKLSVKVLPRFPFRYHLAKYLHIHVREPYMDDRPMIDRVLGRKDEIVWLLRKPDGAVP